MSMIKQYLYDIQEDQDQDPPKDLWESYLEYISDPEVMKVFQQLPEREVWKTIEEYPDYEVSNFGEVYSHHIKRKLILSTDKGGYKCIYVRKVGSKKNKCLKVHRLVGEYFRPNPHNYSVVLHKDNNPSNNFYRNLKWGTHKQNTDQCIREGRRKNYVRTYVLVSPTGEIHTPSSKNFQTFCETHNISKPLLYKVIYGEYKQHKGWTCQVCPLP